MDRGDDKTKHSVYLRKDVYADLKTLLAINGRGINDTVNEAVMRLVGEELGRMARAVRERSRDQST